MVFSPFSPPDAIIEAALRNDARLGRPPRYARASVTSLQAPAETDKSRLEIKLARHAGAHRAYIDAVNDQAEMMDRLARRDLRGISIRTIDDTRARLLHAQGELAKAQEVLLEAEDLDCLDIDDVGTAMRTALHRITATDLSAKTDLEEHGLTAGDLVGRRVG